MPHIFPPSVVIGLVVLMAGCKGPTPPPKPPESTVRPQPLPNSTEPPPNAKAEATPVEAPPEAKSEEPEAVEPSPEEGAPPPGKNWSCRHECDETDLPGPQWTVPNKDPEMVVWSVAVRSSEGEHTEVLGPDLTVVKLPETSSWTCRVGAHHLRVIYLNPEIGIPLWFRELHCADSEGDETTLLTDFDCNARGTTKNSDEMSLWTGESVVRVELSCIMRWALEDSEAR